MTTKCKGNCQTFIGNRSTGAVFCADCGAAPTTPALQQPEAEFGAAVQVLENAAKEFVVTEAARMLADPTDELGKVWDVLHAAGINSGGELSASEGVKLLAGRFTGELMDAYQALQEDFAKLNAALAGMLFEFDDGIGGPPCTMRLLNHARKLVDAKQWGAE